MRIVVISDLHIDYQAAENTPEWVEPFCTFIREHPTEKQLIVTLGDIIDAGNPENYIAADKIFTYMENRLSKYHMNLLFVPGNHDYCKGNIAPFMEFCRKHQTKLYPLCDYRQKNIFSFEIDGINLILADTNTSDFRRPGHLDLEQLSRCINREKRNILMMHHCILTENDDPHTGIDNADAAIKFFEANKIEYIFHGHAHTASDVGIGESLLQFGAGSIRHSKEDVDWAINERAQFHVITVSNCGVECITNWQYRGGNKCYNRQQVYPKQEQEYVDPFSVEIIKYDIPEEYIPRYIVAKEQYENSRISYYFHPEERMTLLSAIIEDNRIILIADAGLGKSIEMQHLAAYTCSGNEYFRPVLLKLRCYSDQNDIIEYISSEIPEYATLDPNSLLLIMDGFDELSDQSKFKKALEKFCQKYKETRIVVSMRSNFYSENFKAFEGFKTYILTELESQEVNNYLENRKIDTANFRKEAFDKNLLDMLTNPFYLSKLADMYIEKKELPLGSRVMEEIVSGQIKKDIQKFEYAVDDLESRIIESEISLKKFAWYFQITRTSICSDEIYQRILSRDDRELLKHSSFTVKSANKHCYSHNNFREYFAACRLASLSFEEAKSYLETTEGKGIAPDWLNTLSFYMQMITDKQELEKWLLEINPLAITKFEPDKVNPEFRYLCLKKQLDVIIKDNVWFYDGVCNCRQLAMFSQSKEALDLLLRHINAPTHIRSLRFCLDILMYFNDLYGKNYETYRSLAACVHNSSEDSCNRALAVEAIAKLELDNDEFTKDLVSSISEPYNTEIRKGTLKYLLVSGRAEQYVEFILQGIINITYENSNDECIRGGERNELINCMLSFKSPESIEKALTWFCNGKNYSLSFYEKDRVIRKLIEQASVCCANGHVSIECTVYTFMKTTQKYCDYDFIDDVITFYKNTGILNVLYNKLIVEVPRYDVMDLLEKVFDADAQIFEDFIKRYSADLLPSTETFEYYTKGLQKQNPHFAICWSAVTAKTGDKYIEPIPRRRIVSENDDCQVFFDALFSVEAMQLLANRLVEHIGKPELTIGQLDELNLGYMELPVGCNKLRFSLHNLGDHDVDKSTKIVEFIDAINWEAYSHNRIFQIIESRVPMPSCTPDQIKYIQNWYYELEEKTDLLIAYKRTENNMIISWNALYFLTLRRVFNFPIKRETALSMLAIPQYYISKDNREDADLKYTLIEQYAEKKDISNKIKDLLLTNTNPDVIDDLLCGCTRYQLMEGLPVAKERCLSLGEPYSKSTALKYVHDNFGVNVIAEEIAPFVDDEFLEYIASTLKKEELPYIENVLTTHIDDIRFLKYLIIIGNKQALETYISLCKKLLEVPKEDSRYRETTSAIAAINDPDCIPLLVELTKVRFTDGFSDREFYSIYSSLCGAFTNCALVDFDAVYSTMIELRERYPSESEIHAFCSRIINDICNAKQLSYKKQWSISEIKTELAKIV